MEPFKNLLNVSAAQRIGEAVARAYPRFPRDRFLKNLRSELEPLELKQRMLLLTSRLAETLPDTPKKSFPILQDALKQKENDVIGLTGFQVWPLTQFVAEYGMNDFALSMTALHHMTQVFTAEFAIRAFFLKEEELTLKQFAKWMDDESDHVRRLVSEGSRPLLPWAQKLPSFIKDPEKTWHLLDGLKGDSSKYVQKSVANHINDHSKNHGEWVVKRLKKWRQETKARESTTWIIRHATRTLVKQGHPGALALHGINPVQFENTRIRIASRKVKIGGALEIDLTLMNPTKKPVPVVADVEVLFLKANGRHSPKVFKGKKFVLEPGVAQTLKLKVPLRPVTTRRYYCGKHGCSLLINGAKQAVQWFELLP